MCEVADLRREARGILFGLVAVVGCKSTEPPSAARDGTVAITVTAATTTMDIASLQTVTAVAKDDKGAVVQAQATLAFESSDPSVIRLLDPLAGVVRAEQAGAAWIVAFDDAIRDSVRITVLPYDLSKNLPTFSVTPIDSAGSTVTVADVNEAGMAVGTLTVNGVANAFRWSNGVFQLLQPAGASVVAVNDSGVVVGQQAKNQPSFWAAGATARNSGHGQGHSAQSPLHAPVHESYSHASNDEAQ